MSNAFDETGSGPRYDHLPVLSAEAKDLPTHVDQCGRRYIALLQYFNLLSRRARAARIESWIYRGLTLPVMIYIAAKLWNGLPGGN
jgi:hypothetical protein